MSDLTHGIAVIMDSAAFHFQVVFFWDVVGSTHPEFSFRFIKHTLSQPYYVDIAIIPVILCLIQQFAITDPE